MESYEEQRRRDQQERIMAAEIKRKGKMALIRKVGYLYFYSFLL